MSLALTISYLTLVLVLVTVIVLCCLGCGCHIPLGKCVRCFCDESKRCCWKQTKKLTEPESAADRRKREKEAPVFAGRRRSPDAKDEPPCAGCLRGIPWVLTCGYCCGAFKEGSSRPPRGSIPTVVGQPVNSTGARGVSAIDIDEVIGTDYVVATRIPLLSIG